MKTSTKILYISLWFFALVAGGSIVVFPSIIKADSLSTGFSAWQHQGIYLVETTELDDLTLNPGDRITSINQCDIEDHLSNDCRNTTFSDPLTYERVRNGQAVVFMTQGTASVWRTIQSNIPAIAGAMVMLFCGLLTVLNIEKVRWFPQLLVQFLLFSMIFIFQAIQLPLTLIIHPTLFWVYFSIYILVQIGLRASLLNLLFIYPQQRFKKKQTRQIILWVNLLLPTILLGVVFFIAPDLITGIAQVNRWLAYYSLTQFAIIILAFIHHLRHSHRPIVNLRLRWVRIATIVLTLELMVIAFLLLVAAGSFGDFLSIFLPNPSETILKPYTLPLLIIFLPIYYAIPLSEYYPRKIDNIENRLLFYLVLSSTLVILYLGCVLLIYRFNFNELYRNRYVYSGIVLTLAVMVIVAIFRAPINRLINRWFYRDRLRYQTLLPGFILELSSNLKYEELLFLLLEKLPEDF
ncbi:MAG: hypothetical protein V2J07_05175 [Anaerolineae bacterium]|jgi:hypothetical protein|nr:hypothetical protein [Anaerolineae bacterium]